MKNIISFSGGKDSTAMLLMLRESVQIDEIIFCDTGKEFPEMYDHIDKVEKYINMPITRLHPEHDFDYYMFDHVKTKGKRKGTCGYGWSNSLCRWCTTLLKTQVISKYLKQKYKNEEYIEYVGIAFDEFERYKNDPNKKYPLIDWKITEGMALKYCYDKGFDWDGAYTKFNRFSCWCCPLKNQKELYIIYNFYPELWQQLKDMDEKAYNQFKKEYSVKDLEEKFKKYLNIIN